MRDREERTRVSNRGKSGKREWGKKKTREKILRAGGTGKER